MNLPVSARLVGVLLFESKTLTLLLAVLASLLSYGFFFMSLEGADYAPILELGNKYTWATVFLAYALLKFYQSVFTLPAIIKTLGSVLGIWLWAYILIAFLIIDNSNITPVEILLVVPVLLELVELIVDMFHCRLAIKKRLEI